VTRIIAGSVGGRRIDVPGRGTRPTSDRVRESIFSSLAAVRGLSDLNVLDLFAGSGALGLEALSRGAASAVFVESDSRAVAVCRRNAESLGFGVRSACSKGSVPGCAELVRADVIDWLGRDQSHRFPFDLVFADPPYAVADSVIDRMLNRLAKGGRLAESAEVVLERPSDSRGPGWPAGFEPGVRRAFGGTVVHRAVWYRPGVT